MQSSHFYQAKKNRIFAPLNIQKTHILKFEETICSIALLVHTFHNVNVVLRILKYDIHLIN